MECAGRKHVHEPVWAKEHFFIRGIVEEHGDDGASAELGLSRRGCGDCAFAEQRFGAPLGAVPYGKFVASSEQVAGHRRAHPAQAKETDFHDSCLLSTNARKSFFNL